MSLVTQVSNLTTRIGTELKTLRSHIATLVGSLDSLTTTDKSNIVAAINEVKASATGAPPEATTTTKGVVELATAAETIAGTDATRAVTPAGFAAATADMVDSLDLSAVAFSGDAADLTGVLGTAQLPALAVNDTFVVASQAAMLALTAERGDMAIREDLGRTFVLSSDSPGTLGDWKQLTAGGDVTSVNGKTGAVVVNKSDVGLSNVDNTSDAAKPVSTAQAAAIAARQPLDPDLTAIAGLTSAANRVPYATGAGTWALTAFTAAGRALAGGADAAAQRTTLSVYSQAQVGNPETDFVAIFEAALT